MKYYLSVLLLFVCLIGKSQPDPVGSFNKHVIEQWTEQYIQISQYKVKGSPYLLGEPFDGQITMKSGIKTTGIKVLYNIYEQKVSLDMNNELVKPNGEIASFYIRLPEKFGVDLLEFLPASDFPEAKEKGYFNIIADGPNASFLRTYKTRLVPDPQNLYSKDFRVFEQYNEYFIFNKKNNKIHKIKLREKDIREALGSFELPGGLNLEKVSGIKKAVMDINKQ